MVAKAYLIFFGNQLISFFYRRKCEKGTWKGQTLFILKANSSKV